MTAHIVCRYEIPAGYFEGADVLASEVNFLKLCSAMRSGRRLPKHVRKLPISAIFISDYSTRTKSVLDLRRSGASETAFRTYAPECEFLHLATHGFFAASSVVKSALAPEMMALYGNDRHAMFGQDRDSVRGLNPGQIVRNRLCWSQPQSQSNRPSCS